MIYKCKNGAISVQTLHTTMHFGSFVALDDVSIDISAGTFHALLGENGAGKSTLVKCIMGFYHSTGGELLVAGSQAQMLGPKTAQKLGLGMVYQHFTLVPSLTAAENLLISRADTPGIIHWQSEMASLEEFMNKMPFRVPLNQPVSCLAAGEKQKLEIIKQLYLGNRFLILDEPTSVLTPAEADEVLGHVRAMTQAGEITVLMITHKFREVSAYADNVSILRKGKLVGGGAVAKMSVEQMSHAMMGQAPVIDQHHRKNTIKRPVLTIQNIKSSDKTGLKHIEIDEITLNSGEILGIAGISGNGQMELLRILTGQTQPESGDIRVNGAPYRATRAEARAHSIRCLPEEPLLNACAPSMSVAENIAFRMFDEKQNGKLAFWKDAGAIYRNAENLIAEFNVKTSSPYARIASLSGGNIQRAVLSRELSGQVKLLIVSNPCFGLDFMAVSAIRDRLVEARNAGTAILLISEDLDEIMELSDRILVMSEGRITYQTPISEAQVSEIGQYMAGYR